MLVNVTYRTSCSQTLVRPKRHMLKRSEAPKSCMVQGQTRVFSLIVSQNPVLRSSAGCVQGADLILFCKTVLEARGDKFRKNEAGISSMFLYHAAIIIHGKTHTFKSCGSPFSSLQTSAHCFQTFSTLIDKIPILPKHPLILTWHPCMARLRNNKTVYGWAKMVSLNRTHFTKTGSWANRRGLMYCSFCTVDSTTMLPPC